MQSSAAMHLKLAVLVCALIVQGCGGGGSGVSTVATAPSVPNPAPVAPSTVLVSGAATYAFVPNKASNGALDFAAAVDKPVRGATVQAMSGSTVLATAVTNEQGSYALTLPVNTSYFLRLRAELINTSGAAKWNVSVKDNTTGGALWVVDSAVASSGNTNSSRSIAAGSGWNGSRYAANGRAAGPFAILDTIFSGIKLVSSVQPTATFPLLDVFWSPGNNTARSTSNDYSTGEIGVTFFLETIQGSSVSRVIYVLGKEDDDTDEYDSSVVGHEFGHYLQSAFSNDHSTGGSHGSLSKLDMTLAFSEGWGTAWSSMMRGTPIYSDSFGVAQASGFAFSLLTTPTDKARGWYREDSIDSGLYALYSGQGFLPIWTAFSGPMASSQNALGSIFSFADAVRSAGNAAVTSALDRIFAAQNIFTGVGADQWGTGETNDGGNSGNLPIYTKLTLNTPMPVCFINENQVGSSKNKLGMLKYFRIGLTPGQAGVRTITANFGVGRDLDFTVYQGRKVVVEALADSLGTTSESANASLNAGEVVIRVNDFITTSPPVAPNCATITIR